VGNAIEIEGLFKSYGKRPVLNGVTLSVAEGETLGYLGPNGSGKTTTIRCLLGLLKSTAGTVRILGYDVRNDLSFILESVGYLPGEFSFWPQLTGRQCLDYLSALQPRPPARREELCELFELRPSDLDKQVRFYSRGMRQKIAIVQGFQHRPQVAILDEPTEGLDPVMKERFLDLITRHRKDGGTTLLSSHVLSEVEECADRVAVLREGSLVREARTAELAGDRVRHCTVKLRKPVAGDFALELEGLSDLKISDRLLKFNFRGEMQPLLKRLARLPVEEFLSQPETLLEAFFDVYLEEPDEGH